MCFLEMIDRKREEVKMEVAAILKRGHKEEDDDHDMEPDEVGEDVTDKENKGTEDGKTYDL